MEESHNLILKFIKDDIERKKKEQEENLKEAKLKSQDKCQKIQQNIYIMEQKIKEKEKEAQKQIEGIKKETEIKVKEIKEKYDKEIYKLGEENKKEIENLHIQYQKWLIEENNRINFILQQYQDNIGNILRNY